MEESHPHFVTRIQKEKNSKELPLSTVQVEQRPKKGESTYLAALLELKQDKVMEVSDEVAVVLRSSRM